MTKNREMEIESNSIYSYVDMDFERGRKEREKKIKQCSRDLSPILPQVIKTNSTKSGIINFEQTGRQGEQQTALKTDLTKGEDKKTSPVLFRISIKSTRFRARHKFESCNFMHRISYASYSWIMYLSAKVSTAINISLFAKFRRTVLSPF